MNREESEAFENWYEKRTLVMPKSVKKGTKKLFKGSL